VYQRASEASVMLLSGARISMARIRAAPNSSSRRARKRTTSRALLARSHDPHDAEQAEDLHLGQGQAAEQIEPPPLAEEVAPLGRGVEEAVGEVAQEDARQDGVHDDQDGPDVGLAGQEPEHDVDERGDGEGQDEALVADVLQLALALRVLRLWGRRLRHRRRR